MPNRPKHLAAGDSSAYLFGEHLFRFLATGEETGGSYSSMEIVSPQDTGPGPHTHDEAEEHFLLLEGTVDFRVDGDLFSVEPGGFVHVPRGAVHEFKVTTPQAKMVATYSPAGDERAFLEMSTPQPDNDG